MLLSILLRVCLCAWVLCVCVGACVFLMCLAKGKRGWVACAWFYNPSLSPGETSVPTVANAFMLLPTYAYLTHLLRRATTEPGS